MDKTTIGIGTGVMFPLGVLQITPGAQVELLEARISPAALLMRHQRGDWGDVDKDDEGLNDAALRNAGRIFSVYRIDEDLTVWVITEWDRSYTTVLLPDEY